MRNTWRLKRIKDRLIRDSKETTLSFTDLGNKYGTPEDERSLPRGFVSLGTMHGRSKIDALFAKVNGVDTGYNER